MSEKDDDKARLLADNKEFLEKQKAVQAESERISDEHLFSSTIVLSVMTQSKQCRTKVAGYEGSLYEIVGAMEEFLADFRNGALTEWVDVNEDGEIEDDKDDDGLGL